MDDNYTLKLERPWTEVRERIKESEMSLTNDDLELPPGGDQQLLNALSQKLNKSPEAVKGWIESLSSNAAQAG